MKDLQSFAKFVQIPSNPNSNKNFQYNFALSNEQFVSISCEIAIN